MALVGELGAGKTQFIKGLAAGVGIGNPTYISSPSFTLINEYPGKIPFYHIDLFRLEREKEAEELGLEDYFQGEGITAIEWADKIPSFLPKEMLLIHIALYWEEYPILRNHWKRKTVSEDLVRSNSKFRSSETLNLNSTIPNLSIPKSDN